MKNNNIPINKCEKENNSNKNLSKEIQIDINNINKNDIKNLKTSLNKIRSVCNILKKKIL